MLRRKILPLLAAIFGFSAVLYGLHSLQTVRRVRIPPGASASEIADLLKQNKILWLREPFLWTADGLGLAGELKAGLYRFSSFSPFPIVLWKIARGKTEGFKFTIPEGWTAEQIARALGAWQITNAEEFLRLVRERDWEGMLFPETYWLELDSPAESVAEVFKKEFDRRWRKISSSGLSVRGRKFSRKQILTLASILEREVRDRKELPLASAVFHNRLQKWWYLESCATVRYAIGDWNRPLLYKDLDVESPYNTYRRMGLPPGPIGNPGEEAIWAALHPADSPVMFFVADGNGTHAFSTRYEQHLREKGERKRR